jgi:hypothetical protein
MVRLCDDVIFSDLSKKTEAVRASEGSNVTQAPR